MSNFKNELQLKIRINELEVRNAELKIKIEKMANSSPRTAYEVHLIENRTITKYKLTKCVEALEFVRERFEDLIESCTTSEYSEHNKKCEIGSFIYAFQNYVREIDQALVGIDENDRLRID